MPPEPQQRSTNEGRFFRFFVILFRERSRPIIGPCPRLGNSDLRRILNTPAELYTPRAHVARGECEAVGADVVGRRPVRCQRVTPVVGGSSEATPGAS